MKLRRLMLWVFWIAFLSSSNGMTEGPDDYLSAIRTQGQEPVHFIRKALDKHDLIVFDDAIHSAQEPFDFYQVLLRDPEIRKRIDYIFVEVFSLAAQPYLNSYFESRSKDNRLLLKVFQDDYSGYGWRYQTYLDLLSTIWELNQSLPASEKLKVIGVSQPIYWEAIHTRQDYDIFQDSLVARDTLMYKIILEKLDHFRSGKKGFFLTNTRHAYKHLRQRNGQLHWNCATFFDQNHPGKMLSIRFHNVTLSVQQISDDQNRPRTAEGLENVQYRWARMDDGKWDQAFKVSGNRPLAIPLVGNLFGKTKYIGNLMLDVQEDQTMEDVYDAVIFLAPLEDLHVSGTTGFLYTDHFKQEVKRRIEILQSERMDDFLKENAVSSLDELIQSLAAGEPKKKSPF